jgi:hypothetical protein
MKVVDRDGGVSDPLAKVIEIGQRKMKEQEEEKERLLQKIVFDWNQIESVVFWRQCFQAVPFEVIRATFHNVNRLVETGYPVRNPSAFFVSTLKKMGYYPWKKEEKQSGEKKD